MFNVFCPPYLRAWWPPETRCSDAFMGPQLAADEQLPIPVDMDEFEVEDDIVCCWW